MAAVAYLPTVHDHMMDTRNVLGSGPPSALSSRTASAVNLAVSPPSTDPAPDTADYQPDLSAEVAMLSTKLVNAINYQTNLDDSLQHARHELEQSRQKYDALDAENRRITGMVANGVLIKRTEMEETVSRLRAELVMERAAREAAEKAKKQMESEVGDLTSSLFEEANGMVAAARQDVESLEKKNIQLKTQLNDTETVLQSQQEQLREMRDRLEELQAEAEIRTNRGDPSIPSTPIIASNPAAAAAFDALQRTQSEDGTSAAEQTPQQPLHYSHLVTPVLRHDTVAYSEFQDLLMTTRRLGVHSRTNSNNASIPSTTDRSTLSTLTSSPSLPGAFNFSSSASSSPSGTTPNTNLPALKDSRFYKRILTEDLEPTLRLDLAPGLTFLSRRTVLAALLTGQLGIAPFPHQNKYYYACTLCGESRRSEQHIRKFHFRTSETDDSPKPLCDHCLDRLRATCDFVGWLRLVRDGVVRAETEEERTAAWEESVRLRERMFWTRLGGGVVPAFSFAPLAASVTSKTVAGAKGSASGGSTRPSLESITEGAEAQHASASSKAAKESSPIYTTPPPSVTNLSQTVHTPEAPSSAVTDSSATFHDADESPVAVDATTTAVEEAEKAVESDSLPAPTVDGETVEVGAAAHPTP